MMSLYVNVASRREQTDHRLVYGHADRRDAETAKGLSLEEARRIAVNIAKLPKLLGKKT